MVRAKVFSETYKSYLAEIRKLDYLSRADLLGLVRENDSLLIPLFDVTYQFDGSEFVAPHGQPLSPAIQVMLCKYMLTCNGLSLSEGTGCDWITYRDFKGSSPLHSYFTNNTNKTLEVNFAGAVSLLRDRIIALGGELLSSDSYDLSARFHAFPRVPVVLNFNDADDMFGAAASVLYKASAAHFLDLECLAMTGTLLTGKLIGKGAEPA